MPLATSHVDNRVDAKIHMPDKARHPPKTRIHNSGTRARNFDSICQPGMNYCWLGLRGLTRLIEWVELGLTYIVFILILRCDLNQPHAI
jgi:hypothetical protein